MASINPSGKRITGNYTRKWKDFRGALTRGQGLIRILDIPLFSRWKLLCGSFFIHFIEESQQGQLVQMIREAAQLEQQAYIIARGCLIKIP